MSIDSSEVLITENYQGKVMEVQLQREKAFPSLEDALEFARSLRYIHTGFGMANIVHGSPDKNEPRAVIYLNKNDEAGNALRERNLGQALITEHQDLTLFYDHDCFRYSPED